MYPLLRFILMATLVAINSSSTISEKFPYAKEGMMSQGWENINSKLYFQKLPYGKLINFSTKISELEMEDIAKELQRQIDKLRKQIKDILTESEKTTDQGTITRLKNQMDDLQVQVHELYKKVDKLSSELQQQFRQKLDDLMRETFEANKKIEARITDLEDLVQKMVIGQCAGNLRDGMVETAIATFKTIKNPALHIEQIIKDAYQGVKNCSKLIDFLKKIESQEELSITAKNEIRVRGYHSLYDYLNKDQFFTEGSDCTYPLAWNVNEIKNRLQKEEIITQDYATRVLKSLPKSISKFAVEKLVKLFVPPEDPKQEIQTCYTNEIGGRIIVGDQYWNTFTKDGTWYMLINQDERPLISSFPLPFLFFYNFVTLSKMKYTSMVDDDRAYWKPVADSNSQVYLQSKEVSIMGTSYLHHNKFTKDVFECYMLALGSFTNKFVYTVQ